MLKVGVHASEYYEYSQLVKTEEFKEKYKKRASHEWKNGEMKRFHGLDRARGYRLKSMGMQAKLTVLAVNLKRIAALISFYRRTCARFYQQPTFRPKRLWAGLESLLRRGFFSGFELSLHESTYN